MTGIRTNRRNASNIRDIIAVYFSEIVVRPYNLDAFELWN
jgi:hypothetical protein